MLWRDWCSYWRLERSLVWWVGTLLYISNTPVVELVFAVCVHFCWTSVGLYLSQTPSLRALGNVVTGNDQQTQYVLDRGLLAYFEPLLTHQRANIQKVSWSTSCVYQLLTVRKCCTNLLKTVPGSRLDGVEHHSRAAAPDSGRHRLQPHSCHRQHPG